MLNVVFYCETPILGGHEKMAVAAHLAILQRQTPITITWVIDESNLRLASALDEAGLPWVRLKLKPTFQILRCPLGILKKTLRLRSVLQRLRPDLVVLVQGSIMNGFDGVIAARTLQLPICSYIPMAHSPAELKTKRFVRFRAAATSILFRSISRYITIDNEQAMRIRLVNERAHITVVENFTNPVPFSGQSAEEARRHLGLPQRLKVLGVIGRIDFKQKCQDWLVRVLGNDSFLDDKLLLFVGDGPNRSQLTSLIQVSARRDHILQLGWRDALDQVYDALDLVLIPSRCEGVPLVMIEALSRKIPVVGSDRDGMKSWLPREWRFPFHDANGMKAAIDRALSPKQDKAWVFVSRHLRRATDLSRFEKQFSQALFEHSKSSK